jgi:STE24 endopeptidase
MEEGDVKTRINELADRLGFETSGIYVMDGSRRSRHSNAYFTGLGRIKRVVLFDTLVEQLSAEELLAVLSHEIGHQQRHHIVKRLVVSMSTLLAGLWVVSLVLPYEPFYDAFGLRQPSYHGILVIISFCAGPFTFFLKPLVAMWSRRHEYEADRFAVDAMAGAKAMIGALTALARRNLSNLTPHPLYSFYHFSHPALAERVDALDAYDRSRA